MAAALVVAPSGAHAAAPNVHGVRDQAITAPDDVAVTGATTSTISVQWTYPEKATFRIYRNGTLVASTTRRHGMLRNLSCATAYRIGVVAVTHGDASNATVVDATTGACGQSLSLGLSAPRVIARGATIDSYSTGRVSNVRSYSIGYCKSASCAPRSATRIVASSRPIDSFVWRNVPADGSYSLLAYAATATGTTATSPSLPVIVDTHPPSTRFASGPPRVTADRTVSFTLDASEPVQRFECNVDRAGYEPCNSPFTVTASDEGSHVVAARAVDLAGNVDPTPAVRTWTYATAPDTSLLSVPADVTSSTTAAVAFDSTDPSATFECSLDGAAFVPCASPATFDGLADGTHTVAVRANGIGGVDPSPAVAQWTVDTIAPFVTLGADRGPDANGWYRSPVSVVTSGTDPGSGIASCSPRQSYSGPDSSAVTFTGTCTDRAGNTASSTIVIRYDATAPSVTAVPARSPDSNGWYNHPVAVSFAGHDAASGVVSCTSKKTFSGPDSPGAVVQGTCVDAAGNVGSATATLRYDATAPSITPNLRQPDHDGWYNHPVAVSFSGSDSTSGGVSCSGDTTYAGPDTGAADVTGTCRDAAGNVASATARLKYDATAPVVTAKPSRDPDHDGWYNQPLSVSFTGADAVSGGVTCDAPKLYGAPDSASASVIGTCTDAAGNPASATAVFKYDATAPTVAASPSRAPDSNGWYNQPLTVTFAGTDTVSGGVTCDSAESYSGPDTASTSLTGSCTDAAGNTGTASASFRYDATPPTVTATASRTPDANGWYNHPLTVSFAGSDDLSGGITCDADKRYSGPDTASTSIAGSCIDAAGNSATASVAFKYDATAPAVTATPSRTPDHNGWYNRPLGVAFSGSDDLSGAVTCDGTKTYSGPDTSSAFVTGSCTDAAGNTGAATAGFRYDATAPTVSATPSRVPDHDGWYNQPLTVSFGGTDAVSGGVSCDAPVGYAGPDTASVALTGSCTDAAGNSASATATLKYDATAPTVTATPTTTPNADGWYSTPVTVVFAGHDDVGDVTCDDAKTYSGPDDSAASLTGSCTDSAGNTASATARFEFESAGPLVTATASRPPDHGGWYNQPLTITFTGASVSGGVHCDAPVTYSGPDDGAASVTGACTDAAGNTKSATLKFQYDATAPSITAIPARPPDAHGWYNHPLSVGFFGSDATSGGVTCDAAKSYSGPDASSASLTGTCTDAAGNSATATSTFEYDATPPTVTAAPSRSPDVNGWYNAPLSVSFTGSDGLSGGVTCDDAKTYAGPDSGSASVTGTCTDAAGNTGSATAAFRYDASAPVVTATPSRSPDHDGWYNRPLSVSFAGSDAVSGGVTCDAPVTYDGPDSGAASIAGTCTDAAGNVASAAAAFEYDATAPVVTATPSRSADSNGWYNHAVAISFAGGDATSGGVTCDAPVAYSGPDDAAASVAGSCTDAAGNSATAAASFEYDATAPTVTPTPSRGPDHDGWYNHPLAVSFTGSDDLSGGVTCDPAKTYSGPDDGSASVSGSCTDAAGNIGSATAAIEYDATAPTVTATPSRIPDSNGWYNHALTVGFAGSDATSGGVTCDADKSYSGPDTASASLTGSCTDAAGNSASATAAFRYDATAPTVTATPSRTPDSNGWYNHPLSVSFTGSDATSGGVTCDNAKSYSGPGTAAASVTGSCTDAAGNSARASTSFAYDATPPTVTATPSRPADSNGWYNHALSVSFTGSDALSGGITCDAAKTYDGPDNAAAAVSGTCTDAAGNTGTGTLGLKFDATPPVVTLSPDRPPDSTSGYQQPVTFTASGTDATSGGLSCDPPVTYSGPDTDTASVSAGCVDAAGNSSSATATFAYHGGLPDTAITNAPSGFVASSSASVAFTSTVDGATFECSLDGGAETPCASPATFDGLADGPHSVSVRAVTLAGVDPTPAVASWTVDTTAPSVTLVAGRPPDASGWYRSAVTFSVVATDGGSGIASCTPDPTYAGPDTGSASVTATCSDNAGNTATATASLRYDSTAPTVTVSASRTPDSNGWYNHAVDVSFAGHDDLSGGVTCDGPVTYSGPDDPAATVTGRCTDAAGNSASATLHFEYDATAPTVAATPSRTADSNGWYNHPLSVSFTGSDATSGGVTCDAAKSYSGPDTASGSLTGSCTDAAGNTASATAAFKYDATAPTVTATPSRTPDSNGWYNQPLSVSFTGSDATSGGVTCDAAKSYSGPDTGSASVSGTCTDAAGNTGSASASFKYDATGPAVTATPSRAPDHGGWYNHPLSVSFTGSDATSGGVTCDAPVAYTGPDSGTASIAGTCTDAAGNVASAAASFEYDATAPAVTASPSRAADHNGWYNQPLSVSFAGNDATSGGVTCDAAKSYSGPDTRSASLTGSCTDAAGNTGTATASFEYDATAPTVSATASRAPDHGGWYNHALTVSFAGNDTTSAVTCDAPVAYSGPDSGTASVTGSCTDAAGNAASATASFHYDATAPTVTATPQRAPDSNGWYNHAVSVSFAGADATSGGVTCDAAKSYSGPDTATAAVAGTCTDAAGNSGTASATIRYDSTGPSVTPVLLRSPDSNGWYNHPVDVGFTGSDATSGGVTCGPAVLYAGPDSAAASVGGTCTDAAGNTTGGTATFEYDATAPHVQIATDRAPDHGQWFNQAVTLTTTGSDDTSGISSCTLPQTYFAPDSANATGSGTCTDVAGNAASATTTFAYDATPPTVTAAPVRSADANGWYNHPLDVDFSATDATSGVDVCPAPESYDGPDSATVTQVGFCSDQAGNVGSATFTFAYDATPPSIAAQVARVPDSNGWYNHPVGVSFSGSDALSGNVVCTTAQTYAGPDAPSAVVAGQCADAAGNVAHSSATLAYDQTPPTIAAAPSRAADWNGWYNHPFGVSFTGSDPMSGVASCSPSATYSGPDTAAGSIPVTCTDVAGNTASSSFGFRYDSTPPVVTASTSRPPDSNGWYNHALTVSFSGSDPTSGGVTCDAPVGYAGPDNGAAAISGGCSDAAGNRASATQTIQYDSTPPVVTVTPSRPPDENGAYNHPVDFTATATDATSGNPQCASIPTYSGPDSASATVTGTCTDAAGNAGTASATFVYQATAPDTSITSPLPSLTNQTSQSFSFASTQSGSTFTCTLDAAAPAPCTSPATYSGLADGSHTFSVAATDPAGNTDPTPATATWTVDTTPPDTSITDEPASPWNAPVSFSFSSPDPTATFQCSLDNSTYTVCVSPDSLGTPPDGTHTFSVRAVDPAGNVDPTPASYTWTMDTQAPTVTFTQTPANPSNSTSATFTWTSSENASFSCRLDAASTPCGTTTATGGTKSISNLLQGSHTFSIRATDAAGNFTTKSFTWTVDTGPPDTDLQLPEPANPTASTTATFTFTATESGSTFTCTLDGAAARCTSPATYTGLATGSHTFTVAATDAAGNTDPTPATDTWFVDATPPTGAVTAPADGSTVSGNTVTVTASASDNTGGSVTSVQFQLDGAALGAPVVAPPYSITWDSTNTADGAHVLTAVVTDEVGNTTTTAPVHVTVSNGGGGGVATSPGTVDVGPGYVDASTRQVIRTSAGRVYIIASDDTAAVNNPVHAATGEGVIRAYKGNQDGTPTAFSEVDSAHHPVSGTTSMTAFGGVDVRLGSDGIARMVYDDNAFGTDLDYQTFSTVTDTWGPAEVIDTGVGTMSRGRIRFGMALDSSDVPHVVYAKNGSLWYSNRAGGTWSTPVAVAADVDAMHPVLAVDGSGGLDLAWLHDNGTSSTIMYAHRAADGTWSAPETVAGSDVLSNINADQGPSIAVDASGTPYVLYVSASKGTFGPTGHTAQYGAIRIQYRNPDGTWSFDSPSPDVLTHAPAIYIRGHDVYAFNGHDTDINFSYSYQLAGGSWTAPTKLTSIFADGSANIRWDPLHETDSSIIDAAWFNEDKLENDSFLGEIYYTAVKPSTDTTPPTVSITAPTGGTVSGSVSVSATASDDVGVAGVQFKLDGADLGSEITSAPYSFAWDTTTVANGTHTLTAVARDAAGHTTTSTPVTVDVENAATPVGGPLFGDNTVYTSQDDDVPGDVEAFAVTAGSAGELGTLNVYLDSPLPSSLLVGLYADTGTGPGSLLASATVATPAAGWNAIGFGPVALTAGTRYWVAVLAPDGGAGNVNFRDGKTGGDGVWVGGQHFASLPDPWPAGGTTNADGPLAAYGTP